MCQPLDESFYQTSKGRGMDKNIDLMANRLFTTMKKFVISLVLLIAKTYAAIRYRLHDKLPEVYFRFLRRLRS